MNHDLFVSYSRVDSAFVLRLVRDLRGRGIETWLDQLDIPPGANWDDEIEKALDQAKIVIVVLSEVSGKSENVKNEIGAALERDKQVVPVLLAKGAVPLMINRLQREDFTGEYGPALEKLVRRLSGGSKTASLQAISHEDVERIAKDAAARLAAGKSSSHGSIDSLSPSSARSSSSAHPKPRQALLWAGGLGALAVGTAIVLSATRAPATTPPPAPTLHNTKPGRGALLCREPRFGGVCERLGTSLDLGSTQVGNDTVASLRLGTCSAVKVCSNTQLTGGCLTFRKDQPNLGATRIGRDNVSSVECIEGAAAAATKLPAAGEPPAPVPPE